jgi:putative peptidoglycan lipid II flippase
LSKSKTVFLSSIKMAIATTCSRILGLIREQFIAYIFGASGMTDAFYVAFRVPNMLRDLLAEGALSSAFVPNFLEAKNLSHESARKLLWSLFLILFAITIVVSGLIIINAEFIIELVAPSFKETPDKFMTTVYLTQLMAPFIIFISMAALFMGALNSMGAFFIPALSPAFFNVSMISSMLIFPSLLADRGIPIIYTLAIGVLFGGFLQAFVQFPLILKYKLGPILYRDGLHDKTKKVVKLLGPGLIGFAATQVNLIVNTILATGTVVGAVSFLSYGFRLFQLPVGILSVSIGNSNLVHFSKAWRENKKEDALEFIKGSTHLSWFFILPATVISVGFAREIVTIIFERGQFDAHSSLMTSKALYWYALGLPFYGLYKIFVPAFYTIEKQMIPVYISIASIIVNIIFCIFLTPIFGFQVLALGTSLSIFLNSLLLIFLFCKYSGANFSKFYSLRVFKFLFCAILTYGLVFFLKPYFLFYKYDFFAKCLYLLGAFSIVFGNYFLMLIIFGERDLVLRSVSKLKSRLSRK